MTPQYDTIIRGGRIVDGTGVEPVVADIAIAQGVIQAVGQIDGTASREIDATGLLVTPGFIDLHTHYDGQVIWSQRLNPSSSHGVTTVVLGNCGVGFAPCRPADRDLLCATMEGVEDIPGVVMQEGLTWEWESFPEYLDALDQRARDIDVAIFAPHSPVRVYAMGDRGADRAVANEADLDRMGALIREAVGAGALGFATSRTAIDRRKDGEYIPSFDAGEAELVAAAQAVRDAGGRLIQMIPELGMTGLTAAQEFAMMRAVSEGSGLPITFTLVPGRNRNPGHWRELLQLAQEHNHAGGALIHAQYFPRPVGMLASFDLTSNPFVHTPAYKALAHLPFDDPHAVMGLGDGGAHYGLVCDSSYPTFVLTHWARDRAGRKLSIGQAVRAMTAQPAAILGFDDRGVIAPGYKADINVIDLAALTLHGPEIVDDLPGGGRRLDQRATGYRCTLVSGVEIARDDQPTGALPGRLVRGTQPAPARPLAAVA